jgi:branched-chain amino acid transport system substrate-binding protein
MYSSPYYFPSIPSGSLADEAGFAMAGKVGPPRGKTKLGTITCVEASVCTALHNEAPGFSQKYHVELVYRGQASLTAPDYTSECASAQQAGAQMVLLGMDGNSMQRILRSCSALAYHPLFLSGGPLATPDFVSNPATDGMLFAEYVTPYVATSDPNVQGYLNLLKQYAPNLQPSFTGSGGYASALLFQKALEHLSEPPTSQSILDALYSIKNYDFGGFTYPMTFTRGKTAAPVMCYWVATIQGGHYATWEGSPRVCP